MDPMTLILTALAAGTAASAKDTASAVIKDSYNGLKVLIKHRLEGKPKAQAALLEYEEDAETYEKPLKKALIEAQLGQDKEIIEAAQRVMALVQPQQAALGKYNVLITGKVQGFAQGDNQHVTMNFGDVSEEK